MSSTPRTLHKFVVYAPDKTDEGAFERRLAVRPKHLEGSSKMHEAGTLRKLSHCLTVLRVLLISLLELGGAMLTPESVQLGQEKKMVGSVLIFEAETLDAVKTLVEKDIYYTSGVVCLFLSHYLSWAEIIVVQWDPEKLVIAPFVAAHM